jgi:ABC-type lipoprotein export system ATPase subunit
MATNAPFILCDNLVKLYKTDHIETSALSGLDLEVQQGEVLAIVGPSGSGKSTLLNILGGLDQPTSGVVQVGGIDLLNITPDALVRYRRDVVGFVWQQTARNLLPYLTSFQNVCMPMQLRGLPHQEVAGRAMDLLTAVGMEKRVTHRTHQLSGGEQQRVAIALALANSPGLLLADEPTGSIDSHTAGTIIDLFRDLAHRYGVTVVIVTHDQGISQHVDRAVAIYDGRTSFERVRRGKGANGHDEYIIVDRSGRMQLPPDLIERLGISGKVRLQEREDHVEIWPVKEEGGDGSAAHR